MLIVGWRELAERRLAVVQELADCRLGAGDRERGGVIEAGRAVFGLDVQVERRLVLRVWPTSEHIVRAATLPGWVKTRRSVCARCWRACT